MLITSLPTVATMVGVNRIVRGVGVMHPTGNPALSPEMEKAFRGKLVATALLALSTKIEKPTVFEAADN